MDGREGKSENDKKGEKMRKGTGDIWDGKVREKREEKGKTLPCLPPVHKILDSLDMPRFLSCTISSY